MASSPAPTVAGAAEQVAGTLTCGRSGSMASLGGPGSCRESCAELATTLAANPTCHGMCVDGVLYDMCQVLDLSTGSQRGPGGEQASSSSTSGSSNMYVKYDGGTLSDCTRWASSCQRVHPCKRVPTACNPVLFSSRWAITCQRVHPFKRVPTSHNPLWFSTPSFPS